MTTTTIDLPKLSATQIESILDKVVPLIAKPEDHEFFRGVLRLKADNESSAQFAAFMSRLLKTA